MRRPPRNLKIAFNHRSLTHYGGGFFFHEFLRVLQRRHWLHRRLRYPRRHHDYSLPQMVLALIYPILLGLDRLETAALLRANGTFQDLTGLPSYPDPQSLRRFLLQAPPDFRAQLHGFNNWLLQQFIHRPEHRSRLILDLDSTVVTVFGRQEGAAVGYNPRSRGQRAYDPLLGLEAHSTFLWDTELRPGNAGTWDRSPERLASGFVNLPADMREWRVRADAGLGLDPVLTLLELRRAQYAGVARMTSGLKRQWGALRYERLHARWEMGECEYRAQGGSQARRCLVARRRLEESEPEPTLLTVERYAYRAWLSNLSLTPAGVWHYYDGRAGMEPRLRELREDFALRKIPPRAFAAKALYLEVVRLAYNLVTAFQQTCVPEAWRDLTLSQLRYKLFWLPGELTRPPNRPTLRLAEIPANKAVMEKLLHQVQRQEPLAE
jgi:hypothetical protein